MIATGMPIPAAANNSAPRAAYSVGGIMPVKTLGRLQNDEREARQRAEAANAAPVVQQLASHIRRHWTIAEQAKRDVEKRMLRAKRSLRGEYDPDILAKLKEQGSSEIYMMLFASKARQTKALLGDVLLSAGDDKPWTMRPTPQPSLPPETVSQIMQAVMELVTQAENSPAPLSTAEVRQLLRDAKTHAEAAIMEEAKVRCARAEKKLDDTLVEGQFIEALDQFLDDLCIYPTAFLKGPVVRRKAKLAWVQGQDGAYKPEVTVTPQPVWERVDAMDIYPAPWARTVNDAFLIERHRLSAQSLNELIGVEGYSADAIRAVIDQYGKGGLHQWLASDSERAVAEGRMNTAYDMSSDLIDALQYWGSATGKQLAEWGLPKDQVPDEAAVYQIEAWLIGQWVIKAAINADPLARRPYFANSFKRVPGSIWGLSLYDTMADCQDMCNAAARALSNNLGIASGPQVWVNVDRIPAGEDIQEMFPWKITQTTSDPMGSSAPPMGFFQPTSNAAELMGVYEKFSQLADEYTGIPRYMTGDGNVGGAGRTASGMSMMVGNAGKTIKSTVSGIDLNVIGPAISRAYEFMMRYDSDMDIKGDLQVVARGALTLITKDAAQVRRNEFLALALNSPVVQEMIGPEGIASLLRAATRTLELDSEHIVPSTSELRMRLAAIQQAQAAQRQLPNQAQGAPTASAQLANGAPVTDNFGA